MDDKVKSQVFTDAYEGNDDSVIKLLATDSNLVTALDSVSTGLILGPVLSGHTRSCKLHSPAYHPGTEPSVEPSMLMCRPHTLSTLSDVHNIAEHYFCANRVEL